MVNVCFVPDICLSHFTNPDTVISVNAGMFCSSRIHIWLKSTEKYIGTRLRQEKIEINEKSKLLGQRTGTE